MLGHVEMKEANLWLQTTEPAKVRIKYWKQGTAEAGAAQYSATTNALTSHTLHIKFGELDHGTTYQYAIYLNGEKVERPYPTTFRTQELWQWRGDAPDFTVALGSCLYINDTEDDRPGEPYGSDPGILKAIADKDPDLMLWLGDNIYYREPDFYTEEQMEARYRDARDTPEMQKLLATSVNLATWDDHDYGPNNSNRSYRMREEALNVFKRYWANPGYGIQGTDGVFYRYKYNDVEFFMMDDRFHRAPNELEDSTKAYFGEQQLQWLMDGLADSDAVFKIIVNGNQLTNLDNDHEAFPLFKKEYAMLMNFLSQERVEGVLFLSGDVHYSQLLKTEREGLYPLYEFTASPLSAGVHKIAKSEEAYKNPQHMEGTLVMEHNFGMIKVEGEQENRSLVLMTYNRQGKKLWEHVIKESELRN